MCIFVEAINEPFRRLRHVPDNNKETQNAASTGRRRERVIVGATAMHGYGPPRRSYRSPRLMRISRMRTASPPGFAEIFFNSTVNFVKKKYFSIFNLLIWYEGKKNADNIRGKNNSQFPYVLLLLKR